MNPQIDLKRLFDQNGPDSVTDKILDRAITDLSQKIEACPRDLLWRVEIRDLITAPLRSRHRPDGPTAIIVDFIPDYARRDDGWKRVGAGVEVRPRLQYDFAIGLPNVRLGRNIEHVVIEGAPSEKGGFFSHKTNSHQLDMAITWAKSLVAGRKYQELYRRISALVDPNEAVLHITRLRISNPDDREDDARMAVTVAGDISNKSR